MDKPTSQIPTNEARATALCELISEQAKKANAPKCALTAATSYATRMVQKGDSASAAERWSRQFLNRWSQAPTDQQLTDALGWIIIDPDQMPTGHRHNAGAVRAGYHSDHIATASKA